MALYVAGGSIGIVSLSSVGSKVINPPLRDSASALSNANRKRRARFIFTAPSTTRSHADTSSGL